MTRRLTGANQYNNAKEAAKKERLSAVEEGRAAAIDAERIAKEASVRRKKKASGGCCGGGAADVVERRESAGDGGEGGGAARELEEQLSYDGTGVLKDSNSGVTYTIEKVGP